MALKKYWAAMLLAIPLLFTPASASEEWTSGALLAFADHLYAQGDFLRAAGEFERYLALTEGLTPVARDSVVLKTGFCYLGVKDYSRALNYLAKAQASSDSSVTMEALLNTAFIHFREGDYRQSIRVLQTAGRDSMSARARLLLALNYLHLKEWREAGGVLEGEKSRQDTLSPYFRQFRAADQAGLDLNYKNPYWAGIMSAVVPGSGKMYAGRFKDGLFSLILVGLTGVVAYEGFHHDGLKSWEGWLFGSLSTGFYAGNIYGSVLAARQTNLTRENGILDGLSFSVHARLPF